MWIRNPLQFYLRIWHFCIVFFNVYGMCMLWVVHTHECVRVGTCACPAEARAGLSAFSSSTFCLIALRLGLSLSLKLPVLCRLADQWPLGIHLCLSPVLEWYAYAAMTGFLWVLEIQTQDLMFVEQVFLPTEPSHPSPCSSERVLLGK